MGKHGGAVTLPRTEGEGNEWEYTWENIPLYHPDDPSIETGETTYQVVELDGEGYVLVEGPEEGTDNEGYKTFTFTNKPVVDFTVTKQWNSVPAEAYNWKVTVGLYRTTEEVTDYTSLAYDVEHMVTNETASC